MRELPTPCSEHQARKHTTWPKIRHVVRDRVATDPSDLAADPAADPADAWRSPNPNTLQRISRWHNYPVRISSG
jgi:hypothetical protein